MMDTKGLYARRHAAQMQREMYYAHIRLNLVSQVEESLRRLGTSPLRFTPEGIEAVRIERERDERRAARDAGKSLEELKERDQRIAYLRGRMDGRREARERTFERLRDKRLQRDVESDRCHEEVRESLASVRSRGRLSDLLRRSS